MADSSFGIPHNVERYMAALSKIYESESRRRLQEIVVNAQYLVEEEYSYDGWNGGTYGHALRLTLPEALFSFSLKEKSAFENKIKNDLNELNDIQNEFIAKVSIDVEPGEDWRERSGLRFRGARVASPEAEARVWGESVSFRVFLSHKAEVKENVFALKERLALFGISAFVAHVDIEPTKEWQDEIENALTSMDAFVALLTDNFHVSDWTDQEVGFAFARGVPLIAVRLGKDPYGFIGKFQALRTTWEDCALGIVNLLMKNDRMVAAYLKALRGCSSYGDGNILAQALPAIERMTSAQLDELVAAFNENGQLRDSWGFNGKYPSRYGLGVIPHLNRMGTRIFRMGQNGIEEETT